MKLNTILPPVKSALPLMTKASYCSTSNPEISISKPPLLWNSPLKVSVEIGEDISVGEIVASLSMVVSPVKVPFPPKPP